MTNEQTLMAIIAIVVIVIGAAFVLIPRWGRKGINVGGIIGSASAGLAQADKVIDTLSAAAPDNKGFILVDKLIAYSQQAVAAAEHLYKTSQTEGDERKEKAAELVHQFAAAAGIEITEPLEKVIYGATKAAVAALPKTDKPASADGTPKEALPEETK